MTAPTFTCDRCGETFFSGWSDEEALAEAEGLGFEGPYGVLCDGCHQAFMAWARSKGIVHG